jgi:hypothetical protein
MPVGRLFIEFDWEVFLNVCISYCTSIDDDQSLFLKAGVNVSFTFPPILILLVSELLLRLYEPLVQFSVERAAG